MEAVGATLAVAGLTIQLVEGLERFREFFEECRDPTIDIQSLEDQLSAVRQLLDAVEKSATEPGSKYVLADTSLKDEFGRCKARMQDLTNLIANFRVGITPPNAGNPSRRIHWRNYLKLHSQQKMIRKYADKLNQARAAVLDHFHITVIAHLSNLHTMQSDIVKSNETSYSLSEEGATRPLESRGLVAQKAEYTITTKELKDILLQEDRERTTPRTKPRTRSAITINQKSGSGAFNMSNINRVTARSGADITMYKQSIGSPTMIQAPTSQETTTETKEEPIGNDSEEEPDGRHELDGTNEEPNGERSTVVLNITSEAGTLLNCNEDNDIHVAQSRFTVFDQHISSTRKG